MAPDDLFDPRPEGSDAPVAGFYQWLRHGRPAVPVRIWFGPPLDPETGEEMDRSWRWQMLAAGRPVVALEEDRDGPFDPVWADVWPQVSHDPIPPSEYEFLIATIRHAESYDPDSPFAKPFRKIDLRSATLPF